MGSITLRGFLALGVALLASACEEGAKPLGFLGKDAETAETGAELSPDVAKRQVDTDVEAPDIFQVTEPGLWDGRPSLGGVWVAHPDVKDPERVIIRNTANGKFVIGALFRRERENPGPKVQISSDTAAALDILAGQPQELNVTALRREEAPAAEDAPAADDAALVAEVAPEDGGPVAATPDDLEPLAAAEAAIAAIESDTSDAAAPVPASGKRQAKLAADASLAPGAVAVLPSDGTKPEAAPAAKPAASSLAKPFIQIGIFSVQANAAAAAQGLGSAGLPTQVKAESSQGKGFWRVVVGPADSEAARKAQLDKVKASGYADAYFVSN